MTSHDSPPADEGLLDILSRGDAEEAIEGLGLDKPDLEIARIALRQVPADPTQRKAELTRLLHERKIRSAERASEGPVMVPLGPTPSALSVRDLSRRAQEGRDDA